MNLKQIAYRGLESIGLYYSTYMGRIADIDDPNNANRIRVYCPKLFGETISSTWVNSMSQYSGTGFGEHKPPVLGQLVYIQCRNGNPRFPVYTYAGFTENQKPNIFREGRRFGFMTPKGQVGYFDDSDNSILIRNVINKNGKGLQIAIKDNELEITNQSGNKITIGEESITIENSKGGSFVMDGDSFTFNGGKNSEMVIWSKLQAELQKNTTTLAKILAVIQNTPSIPEPGNGTPSSFHTLLRLALTTNTTATLTGLEDNKIKH